MPSLYHIRCRAPSDIIENAISILPPNRYPVKGEVWEIKLLYASRHGQYVARRWLSYVERGSHRVLCMALALRQ